MSAGQRWGFHRLSDDAARQVVASAGLRRGELVVDVGAGHGVLTAAALDAGARVLAAEVHPRRVEELRRRFRGEPVTVVDADLRSLRWPHQPFTVVANPPWALLEQLRTELQGSRHLRAAHLVVPRWLARRWSQRHPTVQVTGSVRAEAFTPPARTGAAVVRLGGRVGRSGR